MDKQINIGYLEFCKQDKFQLIKVWLTSAVTSLYALSAPSRSFSNASMSQALVKVLGILQ